MGLLFLDAVAGDARDELQLAGDPGGGSDGEDVARGLELRELEAGVA